MEEVANKQIEDQKKARLWTYIGVAFLVFSLVLSILVFFLVRNMRGTGVSTTENVVVDGSGATSSESNLIPRVIDGVLVPPGEDNLPPFAVMIDNHFDARPPAGIEKAQLVFEAEAEGGITRFMAVFAGADDIAKIGPVRSARSYFIDWAEEISALYVHVGGSPEALARMVAENTSHINEFYNEHSFWRDHSRTAPHNVMTSSELMRQYLEKKEMKEGVFLPWKYDEDKAENQVEAQTIDIRFNRKYFDVSWSYDKENNFYIRKQSGELHKCDSGDVITSRNIVIVRIDSEAVDEVGRLKMDNLGQGQATVCNEGECQEGTWRKISTSSRLRFYDEADNEIPLVRGNTWVEVIKPGYEVTY